MRHTQRRVTVGTLKNVDHHLCQTSFDKNNKICQIRSRTQWQESEESGARGERLTGILVGQQRIFALSGAQEMHNVCLCVQSHVCWTKMMFLELAKGWDQYFSTQDNQLVQRLCVLKSNPATFWYFCPKTWSKRPKNGLKCIGLVWYGLVWLGCDINRSEPKKK